MKQNKMRKEEIIDIIFERNQNFSKQQITKIVNIFLETIKEFLAQEKTIELRGFGTFLIKQRNARKARNPKTGETVIVKERKVPYFKPGTILRQMTNSGKK